MIILKQPHYCIPPTILTPPTTLPSPHPSPTNYTHQLTYHHHHHHHYHHHLFIGIHDQSGDRTVVMEVKGVDHLEIAKHSYVHFLIFENLLANMEQDLCLDAPCQALESEKQKQAGELRHIPPLQPYSSHPSLTSSLQLTYPMMFTLIHKPSSLLTHLPFQTLSPLLLHPLTSTLSPLPPYPYPLNSTQPAANPLDLTTLSNTVATATMTAFEYLRANLPFQNN